MFKLYDILILNFNVRISDSNRYYREVESKSEAIVRARTT